MWPFALACARLSTESEPGERGGSSTESGANPSTSPPVPMIGEALEALCPNPLPGASLPAGDDLRVVTLAGEGRCNDGSPPKLYVRAATDPSHAQDWVWFFDGGGKCLSNGDCAARWCGADPPYGVRHMSSLPLPPSVGGTGITSLSVDNRFAGWNLVFAAYCTSDRWLGTNADVVLDGEPPYRIHFEGFQVASDGIAAGAKGLVSDDGTEALPPLSLAEQLVVAGTSAGCKGVASHTWELAAAAPDAEVVAVFDSCFDPAPDVLDPELASGRDAQDIELWDLGAAPVHGARVAPDCGADHPTEPWRCTDSDLMAREYLDLVMIHHDQSDPVVYDDFQVLGVSLLEYAQLAVATFRLYEAESPHISVHSNNCGIHTAIDGDGTFLYSTVVDGEHPGPPLAEHDVLVDVLAGERAIAVDTAPPTTSVCDD